MSSLIAQLLANFGQHDVGYAGVATGRGGFNLPSLKLPTISQHRLSTFVVFPLSPHIPSSLYGADQGACAFLNLPSHIQSKRSLARANVFHFRRNRLLYKMKRLPKID